MSTGEIQGVPATWIIVDLVAWRIVCRRCGTNEAIETGPLEALTMRAQPFLLAHRTCPER